ncbi:uncharacterized protein LOC118925086 [Manis pentadactyla]|uniref:uncharacterized protein LOC118925086 n=1 Tax=Manis pentadactyla TaxID=143292 RepID=UPI00255CB51D|nr:uncharacterized protein LOC118925086 [Manis pentadactyla]
MGHLRAVPESPTGLWAGGRLRRAREAELGSTRSAAQNTAGPARVTFKAGRVPRDSNRLHRVLEHLLRGAGTRAEETTASGLESACAAGQKGVPTPSAWQVGLVTRPTLVLYGPAQPRGLCLSCSLHTGLKWRRGSGAPTRAVGKQPRCGRALVARSSSAEEVFFRQPGKHTERQSLGWRRGRHGGLAGSRRRLPAPLCPPARLLPLWARPSRCRPHRG